VIPYTLAENAGLNPINIVTDLRNRHANGEKNSGINVRKGCITNILEENVVQPLLVSTSAFELASETVRMIMKIDDIVWPFSLSPLLPLSLPSSLPLSIFFFLFFFLLIFPFSFLFSGGDIPFLYYAFLCPFFLVFPCFSLIFPFWFSFFVSFLPLFSPPSSA